MKSAGKGILSLILSCSLMLIVMGALSPSDAPGTTVFDLNSRALVMIDLWKVQDGDNPEWAKPEFPAAGWPVINPNRGARLPEGVHWMRATVVLTGDIDPYDVLILRFSKFPGAFEIYWDGVLAGYNGRIGLSPADEVVGRVAATAMLSHSATRPGPHLLAVRFSNFQGRMQFRESWAAVTYRSSWVEKRGRDLHLQYFYLGIYLISTFLGLSLFLGGGRQRAFLLFAVYSLLLTLYLAVNPLQEVYNFNVRFFQKIMWICDLVFLSAPILLNIFFVLLFEIPRKTIHFLLIVMIPLIIESAGLRSLLGVDWRETSMALYSLGLLVYALRRRKTGSLIALAGMTAGVSPILYGSLNAVIPSLPPMREPVMILLSLIFVPSIVLSISRQIREQNHLLEAARNRSLRLETELLKSQIQPHFISNTLHSIKSWFRENPRRAEKMIQALSDEFRIINANSSKSLIPLADEIRLCRNHLEIMGSRRDVRFDLEVKNAPPDEMIPPLILHTLIENGITHAYGARESGRFRLGCHVDGRDIVYTLKNDGSRLREWTRKSPGELDEGMGLAYIRARLEESFPGNWSIGYGLKETTWEVTIRIKR